MEEYQVSGRGMSTGELRRKNVAAWFKAMVTCDRYCEGLSSLYCVVIRFSIAMNRACFDGRPARRRGDPARRAVGATLKIADYDHS